MDLQSFISAKVAEELVTNTLGALQSVTQKAPPAELKALVQAEVAKLGTFTFKAGLDLGTVVARLCNTVQQAERRAAQSPNETPSYEALYAAARAQDDGFINDELKQMAMAMATPFGDVINTLRYDLPPQVDTLCLEIRQKAEALAPELNPRRIGPAQIFSWGRLSDPSYLDRVKHTTLELTNVFRRPVTPIDLDILVSKTGGHMYASTPVLQNVLAVKQEIMALVPEENANRPAIEQALDIVLQPTKAAQLLATERGVFDREVSTGRYGLISFVAQIDMLSTGLDALDTVLSGIEASDHMAAIHIAAARLKKVDAVLQLMHGAIEIYRETMINDSIIVPNLPSAMRRVTPSSPPAPESIYVNVDVLPRYQEALAAEGLAADVVLTDATAFYHFYHMSGTTIGVSGLKLGKALEIRALANERVAAEVATESSAEKMAKDRATAIALQKVMEGKLKQKCETHPQAQELLQMKSAQRLQRAQLDLGHGVLALEDQVTHYLIDLEMRPTLSAFQTALSRNLRHWGEAVGNTEAVRSLAFCQSIAQTVTSFLSQTDLIRQRGVRA